MPDETPTDEVVEAPDVEPTEVDRADGAVDPEAGEAPKATGDADGTAGDAGDPEGSRGPDGPGEREEQAAADEDVDLPTALRQRDEYLALARQVQADFENYKKRTVRLGQEQATNATGRLVEGLLPVLDACDAAIIHGVEGASAIHKALFDELARHGLELVPTDDVPFDPNQHEAVLHEPGDGGEPQIVEVLRTGYRWQGRVLRAAMVKVKD